jgi:hypothetical protein
LPVAGGQLPVGAFSSQLSAIGYRLSAISSATFRSAGDLQLSAAAETAAAWTAEGGRPHVLLGTAGSFVLKAES